MQNDLLLRTLRGEEVERPPIWLMRQAGRILPQYRAIRSKLSGFKELVTTPELAAEVTIQPVDELGVDAAIIFSDILVIPEAMGLDYELIEKKGPLFPKTITSKADVERLLSGGEAAQNLEYVYKGLEITKSELNGRVPLIGFSGAPWTLMAYMVEGSGSKTFSKAKAMLYREPDLAHHLLDKLTDTIIAYLQLKIKHGADVIQLFDSWAGMLSPDLYRKFCLPYLHKISNAITDCPLIVFPKGAWFVLEEIAQLNCEAIGLDWTISPAYAENIVGKDKILQGNLDPCTLYGDKSTIVLAATTMIKAFRHNHIMNLGHGVYPDTPLQNVKHLINTVKSYKY